MAQKSINIGRGPKAAIDAAVASGDLAPLDIVVTEEENGKDGELVLIDQDKTQKVITPRTQKDILVQGINLSDKVKDGVTISAGTSLEEFIAALVQKRIAATYTQPTITLANNSGTTANNAVVETGSTASLKIRSTFVKNDAGALSAHKILKGTAEVATGTGATLDYTESLIVPDGATVFKSTGTYAEGAIKNDNLGDASPNGHIAAGTKTSGNYTVTGARKAFYAPIAAGNLPTVNSAFIRGLAGSKLNPTAGSTIDLKVAEGQQHVVFALPKARTVKQITYVDLGDKGMLEKFTKSTVSVEGASTGYAQDYNVYIYSMAAPAAAAMNFQFLLA